MHNALYKHVLSGILYESIKIGSEKILVRRADATKGIYRWRNINKFVLVE